MAVAGLSLGSYPAAAQVASGARPIGASAHTAHVSSGVPRLGHVFVIVGENTSLRQLTPKRAPYIAGRLRRHAAWLVGYKALANSSSLGNYIEMTSGQSIQCERNNSSPVNLNTDKPICHQNVNNISTNSRCTAQPGKSGTSRCRTRAPSWTAALHGPVTCTRCTTTPPCTTTTSRAPATSRTTTWLPARPASDMSCQWGPQPGTTQPPLDSALRKGVVPRFNYIVPNDCENGHDPCGGHPIRQYDRFVHREVTKIKAPSALRPPQCHRRNLGRAKQRHPKQRQSREPMDWAAGQSRDLPRQLGPRQLAGHHPTRLRLAPCGPCTRSGPDRPNLEVDGHPAGYRTSAETSSTGSRNKTPLGRRSLVNERSIENRQPWLPCQPGPDEHTKPQRRSGPSTRNRSRTTARCRAPTFCVCGVRVTGHSGRRIWAWT